MSSDHSSPELIEADREVAYAFTRTGWMKGSDGIEVLAKLVARHRLASIEASGLDEVAQALSAVKAAMLRNGDGSEGDYGWDITALNRARPLIRAALAKVQKP